jgi:hypothetical protein
MRPLPTFALLLAGTWLAPAPARADTYVTATSQVCTGNTFGDCENTPTVYGRGATSNLSRSWDMPPGFSWLATTSGTADYGAFSLYSRASGYESPESGTEFLYSAQRKARSFATFSDTITAGMGGASGFLRLPLHVTGSVTISWQNGFGNASLAVTCASNLVGSPFNLGVCPVTQLIFTQNELYDSVLNLDIPILLGSPIYYQVEVSLLAATGHLYGDLFPFTGASEASFGTGPFQGAALVLDAAKQVIPDALISSESGFAYAPEASSFAGGAAALAALGALAGRPHPGSRAGNRVGSSTGTAPEAGSSIGNGAAARTSRRTSTPGDTLASDRPPGTAWNTPTGVT